jgi:ribokinase
MKKTNVVVIGNITIDDIVLPDGKIYMGVCGGDVLYSALGASFWVNNIGMLTRIGEDFEIENLKKCQECSINIEGVRKYAGESVRNWIIYEYDGRRHFIYRTDPLRLNELSPDPDDIPESYLDAECFFLAAMPVENQLAIAKYLKFNKKIVLLDPYEEDTSNKKEVLVETLRYVDIFMPSEEEEKRFFGNTKHKENIRRFSEFGPEIVIIKLGSDGCMVFDKRIDKIYMIPAYKTIAVDVTGAGDAFGGGYTAGYYITKDPIASAMYGTISASFAIEGIGSFYLFNINRKAEKAKERLEYIKSKVEMVG